MMKHMAIQDWVQALAAIPAREFTVENVLGFLNQHAVRPETIHPYCYFSRGNYTRNLIFKSELFELLAICWEVGQASRIHNHRDQNCWMVAALGRLRVQNFRVEDRNPTRGTCRLVPTACFDMEPGQSTAVNPAEPVHQVLNLAEFNQRAISLHIYSHPFDTCEVYSAQQGTYFDVPLHYTSEYGRLNPEEKLL